MQAVFYRSPIGWLKLAGSSQGIASLDFSPSIPKKINRASGPLKKVIRLLDGYFKSGKKIDSVAVDLRGTLFQKQVWRKLMQIPSGKTVSYQWVAEQIRRPKALRAVARAIGQNKISLLIPCHRVIGKDGSLTGYAWGLHRKKWLLKHESRGAVSHEKN